MKIRTDFVTNSSSSSFIIIDRSTNKENPIPRMKGEIYRIGGSGHTEFGWGPEDIYGFDSKVNFSWLIADLLGKEEYKEMLVSMVKSLTEADYVENIIVGDYSSGDNKVWGYIDHQSVTPENASMFETEEDLKAFLTIEGSHIVLDNDNH